MQDDIRKAAKTWVDKANKANVDSMRQDAATETTSSRTEDITTTEDLVW